jgi:hypothetical protein
MCFIVVYHSSLRSCWSEVTCNSYMWIKYFGVCMFYYIFSALVEYLLLAVILVSFLGIFFCYDGLFVP